MFLTVKNGDFQGFGLIVQNKTAQHLGYVSASKLLCLSRSKRGVKLQSADGKPAQLSQEKALSRQTALHLVRALHDDNMAAVPAQRHELCRQALCPVTEDYPVLERLYVGLVRSSVHLGVIELLDSRLR